MHNTYQIVQALGKTPGTDHKYHCGYFHSEMLGRLSSLQKYPSDPAKLKHCKGEGMLCNHLCEGVVLESRLNSGPLTSRQDPWFPGNSVILYKPNVFILWNSSQWNAENSVVRLLGEFGLRSLPEHLLLVVLLITLVLETKAGPPEQEASRLSGGPFTVIFSGH